MRIIFIPGIGPYRHKKKLGVEQIAQELIVF